jgi:hypothetical protein
MVKSVALPRAKRRLRGSLETGSNDGDSNSEPSSPPQDRRRRRRRLDDTATDTATTIATEGQGAMAIDVDVDGGREMVESAALSRAKSRLRNWMERGSNDGDPNDFPVDAATAIATEGDGVMPINVGSHRGGGAMPVQPINVGSTNGDSNAIPTDAATTIATEGGGTMPLDVDVDVDGGCEMAEAGEDAKDDALLLPGTAMEACATNM